MWNTKLEGRVECSAAILDDFSQVCLVLISLTCIIPSLLNLPKLT